MKTFLPGGVRPRLILIVAFCTAILEPTFSQTNLALGKTVTGSSTFNQPAANLVDGNLTTYAEVANVLTGANTEWMQIDLGADYFIDSVVLTNRPGTVAEQQRGRSFMLMTYPASVSLPGTPADVTAYLSQSVFNRFIYLDSIGAGISDNNPFARTVLGTPDAAGSDLGPAYTTRSFKIGIHKARYVRIAAINDDLLSFAEIQVYATKMLPVRGFDNISFESNTVPAAASTKVAEDVVPGWNTTEGRAGVNNTMTYPQGGVLEVWTTGFLGVSSLHGNNFIELNAAMNSEVSQEPICVRAGETFTWAFAHRGRSGVDVMRLRIDEIDVAEITDNNASTGTHTISILTPATTTGSHIETRSSGWGVYQGTWTNTSGANRIVSFAFRAVSAAGGITVGNFLDSVTISGLTPAASMQSSTASGLENNGVAVLPKIYITGTLSSSQTVQIAITGGTATPGTDYTTPGGATTTTVNIPAGTYDGTAATAITIPNFITVVQDCIEDPNETITFNIQNPSAGLLTPGDGSCGEGTAVFTYTILDNVPDLGNLSATWPAASATFTTTGTSRSWLGTNNPLVPCNSNITRNDGFRIFLLNTTTSVPGSGTQASPWVLGGSTYQYTAQVTVNGNGAVKPVYWGVWYDVNANGSFTDAGDIFQAGTTNHGSPVSTTFNFTVPGGGGQVNGVIRVVATATNTTFTKAMNGQVAVDNGEVEDYYVTYLFALPVTFGPFTATVTADNKVKLDWVTYTEQNNTGFVAEHSSDNTNWQELGFVPTKAVQGNSSSSLTYQYIHTTPVTGTNYYRLKQADANGRISYSIIATARIDAELLVKLMPNPVKGTLYLRSGNPSAVKSIRLVDMNGKLVLSHKGFRNEIDMRGFAAGIYHLVVTGKDDTTQRMEVIKQ